MRMAGAEPKSSGNGADRERASIGPNASSDAANQFVSSALLGLIRHGYRHCAACGCASEFDLGVDLLWRAGEQRVRASPQAHRAAAVVDHRTADQISPYEQPPFREVVSCLCCSFVRGALYVAIDPLPREPGSPATCDQAHSLLRRNGSGAEVSVR